MAATSRFAEGKKRVIDDPADFPPLRSSNGPASPLHSKSRGASGSAPLMPGSARVPPDGSRSRVSPDGSRPRATPGATTSKSGGATASSSGNQSSTGDATTGTATVDSSGEGNWNSLFSSNVKL